MIPLPRLFNFGCTLLAGPPARWLHNQRTHNGLYFSRLPTVTKTCAFPTPTGRTYTSNSNNSKRSFYPVTCNAAGPICLRAPGIFSIRSRLRALLMVTITKWQPYNPTPESVNISLADGLSPIVRALLQVYLRVCSCAIALMGPNHRRTPHFGPAGGSCLGDSQSGAEAFNSQPTGSSTISVRPGHPVEYIPPSFATDMRSSPCRPRGHRWTPSP